MTKQFKIFKKNVLDKMEELQQANLLFKLRNKIEELIKNKISYQGTEKATRFYIDICNYRKKILKKNNYFVF
jgi:hypothetical protein